jgi:threonine dehydrogenase-like Zn-dependent dehydrogenase
LPVSVTPRCDRVKLQDGPALYETFRDKKDGCIKVVMTP